MWKPSASTRLELEAAEPTHAWPWRLALRIKVHNRIKKQAFDPICSGLASLPTRDRRLRLAVAGPPCIPIKHGSPH